MGKKVKIGKDRRDKFYHLAKETGYRARSAFKLIQLNRQFEFLGKARVCIDLCAAPGGWMQVAKKEMPSGAVIVGVDLVPIKPIAGCVGIVADITTEKCRTLLKKELNHFKADVVLHDGAPNVGKSWIHDAYTQSELVLKSLKLATEYLTPGGTFVTKVFRSKDYQSLVWVFNQLFRKVHATKPTSSRNVSAEIFVVCQDYLAPHKIDPKFLDPKHVFEEIEEEAKKVDIFADAKRKPKAAGYEEGNYMLHKVCAVEEFINSNDHLDILAGYSELTFSQDSPLLKHPETTEEIRLLVKDLKVLGKKDFKTLLKWRSTIRDDMDARKKRDGAVAMEVELEAEEGEESEESEDEEAQLDRALTEAEAAAKLRAKQLKRKKQKQRQKLREKMSLHMDVPHNHVEEDLQLFDMQRIKTKRGLDALDDEASELLDPLLPAHTGPRAKREEDESEEEEEEEEEDSEEEEDRIALMERQLDRQYEEYQERKQSIFKRVKFNKAGKKTTTIQADIGKVKKGVEAADDDQPEAEEPKKSKKKASKGSDSEDDSEGSDVGSGDEAEEDGEANPLIAKRKEVSAGRKTAMWFSQDLFQGIEDEELEEEEEEDEEPRRKKSKKGAKDEQESDEEEEEDELARFDGDEDNVDTSAYEEQLAKKRAAREKLDKLDSKWASKLGVSLELDSADEYESEADTEDEDEAEKAINAATEAMSDAAGNGGFEEVSSDHVTQTSNVGNLDAAGLALATEMIARKRKREIIDKAYNRYAFNDDPLPEWFADEEVHHRQFGISMTKEMVREIKARERELNARPIKKVLEAKGRKKNKMRRSMSKLNERVTLITENATMTEKEKANAIESLYKKAFRKKKEETTYVVASRAVAAKRPKRPNGVKGRYMQVDKRMLKEKRAKKIQERRMKKRKH